MSQVWSSGRVADGLRRVSAAFLARMFVWGCERLGVVPAAREATYGRRRYSVCRGLAWLRKAFEQFVPGALQFGAVGVDAYLFVEYQMSEIAEIFAELPATSVAASEHEADHPKQRAEVIRSASLHNTTITFELNQERFACFCERVNEHAQLNQHISWDARFNEIPIGGPVYYPIAELRITVG
jgi:hypothetical protein